MKIQRKDVTIRELTDGYTDNGDQGVLGYDGQLDIRPPYQREFVYDGKQRAAVIETVMSGFPLNVMYWAVRDDGGYEIIDGQQRTISLAQYVDSDFAVNDLYFHNLPSDQREKFLDYELMIYVCEGRDSQKLEWFKTINIAGAELTPQELRNAVYAGSWVTDAKRHFSRTSGPAHQLGGDYLNGKPIRQEYLETAIKWFNDGDIEGYMAKNQHKSSASELWIYFQSVISWIQTIFPNYRKHMKGLPWGELYNRHKDDDLDPAKLEEQIAVLIQDDEVESQKGIYQYLLTGDEKHLNLRAFDDKQKLTAYERQNGICNLCNDHFQINQMEADHITPWREGGKTELENCQMLCRDCNRRKGAK